MDMDVDQPSTSQAVQSSDRQSSEDMPRASSVPLHPIKYTVGYVYAIEMMVHYSTNGHPEQAERIKRIWDLLHEANCLNKMKRIPIRSVRREEVLLIHSQDHWDKVQAIQHMTAQEIADSEAYYEFLSLYVMPGTTKAALLSCGGVIEATLAVARGEIPKTFAIVRPPGHHAEPDEHMGFCFFNNVAVATRVVQHLTPIKRVMILDWDVHHGNGTQRAFYDDPSVLYVSLHRYERGLFYPCGPFGSLESCGEGSGLGYSVNIPWPEADSTDADYIHAFQKIVMPIAIEFAPELVIISAGFDAADGDDLGECHVTPAGYAHMTHMLSGLADGRLVVALEGGYNLDASASSALAVAKVLLGEAPPILPPLVAREVATEAVWQVAVEQSKYWKNVDPKACEPRAEVEPISFSIPEILKAHRQHYLYSQYKMLQIPLLNEALEERFGTQIMCSPDLMEKPTMIVLVHEFGNLQIELQNSVTCNLELEHSYHVDFSKELIAWIQTEGHSLLDVNLFPRPFTTTETSENPDQLARGILTYLWDNYIHLSGVKDVVFIGHGPGCEPLLELLNQRSATVMPITRAVIQVVGHAVSPILPKNVEVLRSWYREHAFVILPSNHVALLSAAKFSRNHGKVLALDESKAAKLIIRGLPFIQDFVKKSLGN